MSIQILVLMNNNEYNYEENLSSGYLKTYLVSKGIDVTLDYWNIDHSNEYEKIIDPNAKIIAFALTETNVNDVYTAIDFLKRNNDDTKVCVFDNYATYHYKEIFEDNEHVDFIPYGNPNEAIWKVYKRLIKNESWEDLQDANILYSNNNTNVKYQKSTFNSCTYPDRDNLKEREAIIAHIISSYGCPAHCSFCTMPQLDNSITFRDMNDVYNEITGIYEKYKIRFFHFNDATFEAGGGYGKERIAQLCDRILQYPVKFGFRCFIRASSFVKRDDLKYLSKLKSAGFQNLFVGIESGNDDDLILYNKKATVSDNEAFLALCKEVGLTPFWGFVMLNPYSTLNSIKENYSFLVKWGSDQFSHYTNCLQIYSNTKMYDLIATDGLLYNDYNYKKDPFQYSCADPKIDQIKQLLMNFNREKTLQKQNSSYHNLIFLKNYLCSIGITDNWVDENVNKMAELLTVNLKNYFGKLYIENDVKYCTFEYNRFIASLLDIYSNLEPLKKKLLKVYYKSSFL